MCELCPIFRWWNAVAVAVGVMTEPAAAVGRGSLQPRFLFHAVRPYRHH